MSTGRQHAMSGLNGVGHTGGGGGGGVRGGGKGGGGTGVVVVKRRGSAEIQDGIVSRTSCQNINNSNHNNNNINANIVNNSTVKKKLNREDDRIPVRFKQHVSSEVFFVCAQFFSEAPSGSVSRPLPVEDPGLSFVERYCVGG